MTLPQHNLFTHNMNVRIDDINFGNHLCHSKFTNIIHNVRALFLKSFGLSESSCFGCGLIMLNLNVNYLSQCFFDDRLKIDLSIESVEKATVLFSYSVFNQTTNKVAAEAKTLMGFLDIERGKLKKVPLEFKKDVCNII